MLKGQNHLCGDLPVLIYDFPEIGDVLEMHTHDEKSVHVTIVARGAFKASGEGWEQMVKAGDFLDWAPYQPHEFVSLEADSRIVNITKNLK